MLADVAEGFGRYSRGWALVPGRRSPSTRPLMAAWGTVMFELIRDFRTYPAVCETVIEAEGGIPDDTD